MDSDICAIKFDTQHEGQDRGVHFLDCPSVKRANGLCEFMQLPKQAQFYFRASFDYWNDRRFNDGRFHGFKSSYKKGVYKECFVFKNIGQKCRLYGFLSRPESPGDAELCILVLFCQKKEDATDETMLKRVNEIRARKDVIEAIRRFRDEQRGS
jgi:hypothetical protein